MPLSPSVWHSAEHLRAPARGLPRRHHPTGATLACPQRLGRRRPRRARPCRGWGACCSARHPDAREHSTSRRWHARTRARGAPGGAVFAVTRRETCPRGRRCVPRSISAPHASRSLDGVRHELWPLASQNRGRVPDTAPRMRPYPLRGRRPCPTARLPVHAPRVDERGARLGTHGRV